MPQLVGKYIFSDIVTGRLFYSDLAEMQAAQRTPRKMAVIHELQVFYESPYDKSAGEAVKRRMFDIVADAYKHKEGVTTPTNVLPGRTGLTTQKDPYGIPYGGGRADVRFDMGGDGELYLMGKTDGTIRKLVAVVTPPPAP